MRVRSLRRSGFLAVAAWVLLASAGVRGDIQNPGRSTFPGDRRLENRTQPPPNAVPQTVSVVEGGTVPIILRARGHSGEMVDFVLRTPPPHGPRSGEPRQRTHNTAELIYTHHPGDNVAADSFTYAVQTRDSPLSAEAAVTVRIQEPPPVLTISPAELDFGAVKAGETTRAELTLTNQGGGEATGRLDPPPPWVIDGNATYRLPRGGSQTFALVFHPQGEHAYVDALHFRYETGGGVRLIGTGLAGPRQTVSAAGAGGAGALVTQSSTPQTGPGADASPTALSSATAGAVGPAPGVAGGAGTGTPATDRPAATSLEPVVPAGVSSLPLAAVVVPGDPDTAPGVNSVAVHGRGRTTLDLTWRALVPPPKSYRVELRHLSQNADDKLIVEWRPYALTEFDNAHGFVNAHLSGLSEDSQECIRVVAVDASGRLAAPSPLLVAYTLPASTWWRPTPLKVLFALLILCGGIVIRQRWETNQLLRSIDESRRASAA